MADSFDRRVSYYREKALQRYCDNYNGQAKASLRDVNRRAGEKQMAAVIARGDLTAAGALAQQLRGLSIEKGVGTMSYNDIHQLRYTLVSAVTLYCRAALDGGLPERYAYGLSDSLIQIIEELDDAAAGPFMAAAMLIFTEAVYRNRFTGSHPTLRQCHEYIISHLGEPIRLTRLAEVCGRNPGYLSELFEKELGIRPAAYIRKCKLEASRQDLDFTRESVAAIADAYAFPSTSAFCTQFKAAYGMSPLQYRAAHREPF